MIEIYFIYDSAEKDGVKLLEQLKSSGLDSYIIVLDTQVHEVRRAAQLIKCTAVPTILEKNGETISRFQQKIAFNWVQEYLRVNQKNCLEKFILEEETNEAIPLPTQKIEHQKIENSTDDEEEIFDHRPPRPESPKLSKKVEDYRNSVRDFNYHMDMDASDVSTDAGINVDLSDDEDDIPLFNSKSPIMATAKKMAEASNLSSPKKKGKK